MYRILVLIHRVPCAITLHLREPGFLLHFSKQPSLYSTSHTLNRDLFVPKRDEMIRGLGKLHNEELHNLYSSPSVIRMIKSRRVI
jgi:hypothetical protein